MSDLYQDVLIFAINHHTKNGIDLIGDMRFCSEKEGTYCDEYDPDGPLIFFDIEVKPNMNLLCWKYEGDDQPVIAMFNPKPEEIDNFLHLHGKYKSKIIGYNNKEYEKRALPSEDNNPIGTIHLYINNSMGVPGGLLDRPYTHVRRRYGGLDRRS